MATAAEHSGRHQLTAAGLEDLHRALTSAGYRVIGPRATRDAIVLGELKSASDLPFGWGVSLSPGGYRLRNCDDSAAFGHSAGPGSWKQFLHPPREKLWSVGRTADGLELDDAAPQPPEKLAFLGVRPCDLRAIQIQDRVLGADRDSAYARHGLQCSSSWSTAPSQAKLASAHPWTRDRNPDRATIFC